MYSEAELFPSPSSLQLLLSSSSSFSSSFRCWLRGISVAGNGHDNPLNIVFDSPCFFLRIWDFLSTCGFFRSMNGKWWFGASVPISWGCFFDV
jgi:hypothetical protein